MADAYIIIDEAAMAEFTVQELTHLFERTVTKIESAAKKACPVNTGRLRASITHEVSAEGKEVVARVGTNVEYAAYVEFGTRHMPARSFLRSALGSVQTTYGYAVEGE